jgi:hypothetical protein
MLNRGDTAGLRTAIVPAWGPQNSRNTPSPPPTRKYIGNESSMSGVGTSTHDVDTVAAGNVHVCAAVDAAVLRKVAVPRVEP